MTRSIPAGSRVLVGTRDKHRCVRCLGGMGSCQWHHRRTRAVVDEHQHCPCVGILLCSTCHRWVHSHAVMARAEGWIVSRHEVRPGFIPFKQAPGIWVMPRCNGDALRATASSLGEAIEEFGEREDFDCEVVLLPGVKEEQ